jgi:sulfane dehydrogenase subunit SoxC
VANRHLNREDHLQVTRRRFLTTGAASLAGAAAAAQQPGRALGSPRRTYGERSPFETSARLFGASVTPGTGASRTPLQDSLGIITPSALHFERHHAGVPANRRLDRRRLS